MSSNSVCKHTRDYQIGLPLRGRPILLITRMITDRIGLYSFFFLPQLQQLQFFFQQLSYRRINKVWFIEVYNDTILNQ